ncbi:MAG: hypothetical protein EOO04_04465 [Chitinophagaceae bacterium]|nr:MAG: hypothetical protein EOO04_04465 [Chitinophagaceae bacterium]
MPDTKIHDVESLNRAIAALEQKKKILEEKLEESGKHLQDNFMSMAFKSAVPKTNFDTGPIAAATSFFKSDRLKDGFNSLVSSVSEMASEGIETIVTKLKGRKDREQGS